ncbi:hypothetical protein AAT19DRAFT_13164 [Rhodotorula toruloides]|uniref:Uncharacterized protein n=1 Tax=Rhodotorula toruloides TaxID=5286 RepID=A0A2T0ADR9_RHOTO|nr:hypothetical protein AAT19DRAFT_13164 [Rhodotorula toruloides]
MSRALWISPLLPRGIEALAKCLNVRRLLPQLARSLTFAILFLAQRMSNLQQIVYTSSLPFPPLFHRSAPRARLVHLARLRFKQRRIAPSHPPPRSQSDRPLTRNARGVPSPEGESRILSGYGGIRASPSRPVGYEEPPDARRATPGSHRRTRDVPPPRARHARDARRRRGEHRASLRRAGMDDLAAVDKVVRASLPALHVDS